MSFFQPTSFEDAIASFRAGTLSVRDYLEQRIGRIEQAEPTVKAFAHLDLAGARAQADAADERYRCGRPLSPIDGMPIGIKDIIDTADMPTCMGSALYQGHRPLADAAAVQAVRAGGAVVLGKTRTTEFAIGRATVTTNPSHAGHTPGGSSSGTAAGVASGMFCAGLGTQTQGSIIRPASYCGVVGYKPSWGALPLDGVHPVAASHDHLGVIADGVDTAWRLAWWIACNAPTPLRHGLAGPGDNRLHGRAPRRLGVLRTEGYAELDDAALAAFEASLDDMRGRGIEVVEADGDPALAEFCRQCNDVPSWSVDMMAYEMQWPYRSYAQHGKDALSAKIQELIRQGEGVGRQRYGQLLRQRQALAGQAAALGQYYDALVLPAASGAAPAGLENTGSRTLLVYSSFLGLPACSLPLQHLGQLPFGMQLIGFSLADHRLLCHARWLMHAGDAQAA